MVIGSQSLLAGGLGLDVDAKPSTEMTTYAEPAVARLVHVVLV